MTTTFASYNYVFILWGNFAKEKCNEYLKSKNLIEINWQN